MRETIAKVLAHHDGMHPDAVSNDSDGLPIWSTYLDVADAVLDVLMDPSNEMLEAMHIAMYLNAFDGHSLPKLGAGFEAAIQAAKEGK